MWKDYTFISNIKGGWAISASLIKRGAVTQLPIDKMTWDFACEEILGGTFEFCSSQGHLTSKGVIPAVASKSYYIKLDVCMSDS